MKNLTAKQCDALKEMGNIGAGHAALALSQLMGRKIMIAVPVVKIEHPSKFLDDFGRETVALGSYLKVVGDMQGGVLIFLTKDNALKLSDVLMKQNLGATKEFGEVEQSAIKETCSILAASYLTALGQLAQMTILPSVPNMFYDKVGVVFTTFFKEQKREDALLIGIENEFIEASIRLKGYFLFVPETKWLAALLGKLGE